jgi:hypothetical protein
MKQIAIWATLTIALLAGDRVTAQNIVARTLTQNDLKNLQVLMEAASAETGKLPDKAAIMAALKMEKAAANLVKAIEGGTLILTGTSNREDVWAYEKAAPEKGGWFLTSNGVERLDAQAAKKRLGK